MQDSVGDADNFRLYHTPGFGWRWPIKFRIIPSKTKGNLYNLKQSSTKFRSDLKDQTIHIRIAGVDAPEAAHFGRPAQPYSAEALAWLKNAIEGKMVYCQLIQRDQYSRIVCFAIFGSSADNKFTNTGRSRRREAVTSSWLHRIWKKPRGGNAEGRVGDHI